MPAVDFDRQAIERRDFPVSRRGYDPAAVDAHLRALASEFEELGRAASGGETSLASAAASQVQSIIQAAETAAGEIERQAVAHATSTREAADQDAERTRQEAIERARAHVAAVAEKTAALLERVESVDGEMGVLAESLRTSAGRLAGDLSALEGSMDELYDAASGRGVAAAGGPPAVAGAREEPDGGSSAAPSSRPAPPRPQSLRPPAPAARSTPAAEASPAASVASGAGDLDGARLIALNMALNGESRADAERYLAEHFQSIDRLKLIDEVYAAIEG
jgi:DivIVA domain-containing protein